MDRPAPALVRALEETAFRAWPAAEVETLDGWALRATGSVTRRANSVFTSGEAGSRISSLEERIARAEAFYAERAITPRFQLSPLSVPSGLDAELDRRGYLREAPVSLQIAETRSLARVPPAARVELEAVPSERWLDVAARQSRFRESETIYRALLGRIGPSARFALGILDGVPLAAGISVVDGDFCGIFSMLTLPAARRKGLARGVLLALAHDAHARGANTLYLQVERENPAALALYAALGFSELYGYHYRVRNPH